MSLVVDLAATVICAHVSGLVGLVPSQKFARITGAPILVKGDLNGRPIAGCPFFTGTNKPCTSTLAERELWSNFVTVGGIAVCLDTTFGLTHGGPGVWQYNVANAGQAFVTEGIATEVSEPSQPIQPVDSGGGA